MYYKQEQEGMQLAHPSPSRRRDVCQELRAVSDNELLRRLGELVGQSRRVEADLVAHIGEVEERRLFARFAFPSMFAYCTEALHLSEAEAYRRITVARAARRDPELLELLRDGRLHLTGLALLVPRLTPANRDEVLRRATHRSKREIEELVAELAPRPDVPSRVRKLPQRRVDPRDSVADTLSLRRVEGAGIEAAPGDAELFPGTVGAPDSPSPAGSASVSQVEPLTVELFPGRAASPLTASLPMAGSAPGSPAGAQLSSTAPEPPSKAVVQALSPGRYKVQFTASAELKEQLARLVALMRSEVPDGDVAQVIARAVAEKLERLEARRFARTQAPRQTLRESDPTPRTRHIPAAVRRAVRVRDQDRCRFVDELGRRCSERHRLEFHHRYPYGMGGDHSLGNVMLLCPQHNRHLAEHDYGRVTNLRRPTGKGAAVEAFSAG